MTSDRNAELLVELMDENCHEWRAIDFELLVWGMAGIGWTPAKVRRFTDELFAAVGELHDQEVIAKEQGDNQVSRAYRDGISHDIRVMQAELCTAGEVAA